MRFLRGNGLLQQMQFGSREDVSNTGGLNTPALQRVDTLQGSQEMRCKYPCSHGGPS